MKENNVIKYFSKKDFKSVYLSQSNSLKFLFQKNEYIVVKKIDIQKIVLNKIESTLLEIDNVFGNVTEYDFYKNTLSKIKNYINLEIEILDEIAIGKYFVKCFSHELLNNFFILRMEYCPYMSVADYINNNVYDGRFIYNFITDMDNALVFLKKKHIIHRDLKLNNILYKNDVFKITDFELSCFDIFTKSIDTTKEYYFKKYYKICGTLRYISPEMITSIGMDIEHTHFYDCSTDIWSIGCCLYQLVFSKNLFENISSIMDISFLFKNGLQDYLNKKIVGNSSIVLHIRQMLNIDKSKRIINTDILNDTDFLSKEFKIFSLNSWEIIESASIQNLNKEFHQWLKDHN